MDSTATLIPPLIMQLAFVVLGSALGMILQESVVDGINVFPATYTLLGMMVIEMTLAQVAIREAESRFIGVCLLVRYGLWSDTVPHSR